MISHGRLMTIRVCATLSLCALLMGSWTSDWVEMVPRFSGVLVAGNPRFRPDAWEVSRYLTITEAHLTGDYGHGAVTRFLPDLVIYFTERREYPRGSQAWPRDESSIFAKPGALDGADLGYAVELLILGRINKTQPWQTEL